MRFDFLLPIFLPSSNKCFFFFCLHAGWPAALKVHEKNLINSPEALIVPFIPRHSGSPSFSDSLALLTTHRNPYRNPQECRSLGWRLILLADELQGISYPLVTEPFSCLYSFSKESHFYVLCQAFPHHQRPFFS